RVEPARRSDRVVRTFAFPRAPGRTDVRRPHALRVVPGVVEARRGHGAVACEADVVDPGIAAENADLACPGRPDAHPALRVNECKPGRVPAERRVRQLLPP